MSLLESNRSSCELLLPPAPSREIYREALGEYLGYSAHYGIPYWEPQLWLIFYFSLEVTKILLRPFFLEAHHGYELYHLPLLIIPYITGSLWATLFFRNWVYIVPLFIYMTIVTMISGIGLLGGLLSYLCFPLWLRRSVILLLVEIMKEIDETTNNRNVWGRIRVLITYLCISFFLHLWISVVLSTSIFYYQIEGNREVVEEFFRMWRIFLVQKKKCGF